ncbi:MAG TPA: hypothetical protein VGH76_07305 [Actinomycetospora sp.]|jgi:hypothetical protein|uniref:hypothetical protein n=1 Tax=Actinomycetospora sp. TaxID=1872135 RepID=UPI002F3F1C4F
MAPEERSAASIREALHVLRDLDEHGDRLCPAGSDRTAWARSVLEELAQAAGVIGGAVQQVSGRRNDTVSHSATALAGTISAHTHIAFSAQF